MGEKNAAFSTYTCMWHTKLLKLNWLFQLLSWKWRFSKCSMFIKWYMQFWLELSWCSSFDCCILQQIIWAEGGAWGGRWGSLICVKSSAVFTSRFFLFFSIFFLHSIIILCTPHSGPIHSLIPLPCWFLVLITVLFFLGFSVCHILTVLLTDKIVIKLTILLYY